MAKPTKKKLQINGMRCSSCAMNIDFELEDLKGIKGAKTSYAREECEVEFEKKEIQLGKILETIEKMGYQAQIK